jgi:hypothetical protein
MANPVERAERRAMLRRVARDLVLVELAAMLVIAFAYFIWPYPPLAWQPNYDLFYETNFITVFMAAIAWVGAGYIVYEIGTWGARLLRRKEEDPR